MNIIRFSQGKQPQIKIGDLGTIYIPDDIKLQMRFLNYVRNLYQF
jgi:hypothetical protein